MGFDAVSSIGGVAKLDHRIAVTITKSDLLNPTFGELNGHNWILQPEGKPDATVMSNRPQDDAILEDLEGAFAPLMDPNEDPYGDVLEEEERD